MLRLCIAVLAFVTFSSAYATDAVLRRYQLPNYGAFEMAVPNSWKDTVRQAPNGMPPTISFKPIGGVQFEVLVTPIWPQPSDGKAATLAELKANVRDAAASIAAQAIEKAIEVRDLKGGSSIIGYYYTATDRAPKPGEYKLLTQGMLGVRDLRVSFTILTNDGQEETVRTALSMLSSATSK